MAFLTTVAAMDPVAVKGLAGSSFNGDKLAFKPSRLATSRANLRSGAGAVVAKYGDKSVYFVLEDLPNTTGQWDLYGSDAPSPYNPLQDQRANFDAHQCRLPFCVSEIWILCKGVVA